MRTPSLAASEVLIAHDVLVMPLSKLSLVVTRDRTPTEVNLLAGAMSRVDWFRGSSDYSRLCKAMVGTRGCYSTGERQGKARGD